MEAILGYNCETTDCHAASALSSFCFKMVNFLDGGQCFWTNKVENIPLKD